MPGRPKKVTGFAEALSREIEQAVVKAMGGSNIASTDDIKDLTEAIRALNRLIGGQLVPSSPKGAGASVAQKKKGPKPKAKGCSVAGCKRKHYAKGLCASHYNLELRRRKLEGETSGAPKVGKKRGPKPGFKRVKPGRKPGPKIKLKPGPKPKTARKVCSVAGCGNPHYSKGLCRKHYAARRYQAKKKTGKK